MPYTLNGFGTKYYRRRDWSDDGSCIASPWITARMSWPCADIGTGLPENIQ